MKGESVKILFNGIDIVSIMSHVKQLQLHGYEVHTAFSTTDLLDVLKKHHFEFDLIITDVRLNGLSLYQLTDYIAMNSGGEVIPFLGIVEFPRDEELMTEEGDSFALIIEKGFKSQELLNAVYSLVNIDFAVNEGLSEQQIRHRAQQLKDTQTVPLRQNEYINAAQEYLKNSGHQSLKDQFKDL